MLETEQHVAYRQLTVVDANGRTADFRNVILVMTTNAGAADMSKRSIGFTDTDASSDAFSFVGWDGTLAGGQPAPAGTYQLRLKVLKALMLL